MIVRIDIDRFIRDFEGDVRRILGLTYSILTKRVRRRLIPYYKDITPVKTGRLRRSLRVRQNRRRGRRLIIVSWTEEYAYFPQVREVIFNNLDEEYAQREFEREFIRSFNQAVDIVARDNPP